MPVTLDITGKTRVFGIIADPIHHVRAPMVFNEMFERTGRDAIMVPLHVRPEQLPTAVEGFKAMPNFGGLCVTVPHKVEIMKLCDTLGEQGRLIGATNAVRFDPDGRMSGDMFDGKGFIAGMRCQGFEPAGKSVLQLGAGGAGRAIAFALASEGVSKLVIHNRTRDKAEELATAVKAAYPSVPVEAGDADPRGLEIIVNTTSLGLHDEDPLPMETGLISPEHLVAEIIMIPVETPLLKAAKAKGAQVHYGRHMLDEQITLIADYIGA